MTRDGSKKLNAKSSSSGMNLTLGNCTTFMLNQWPDACPNHQIHKYSMSCGEWFMDLVVEWVNENSKSVSSYHQYGIWISRSINENGSCIVSNRMCLVNRFIKHYHLWMWFVECWRLRSSGCLSLLSSLLLTMYCKFFGKFTCLELRTHCVPEFTKPFSRGYCSWSEVECCGFSVKA